MATDKQEPELFDAAFLARLESLHLISKRIAARPSGGRRRARRLGDGLEFADHRDYASGDDIRFIDWPYLARMEKLLLRLFHEHSETDVAILLDTSASMAPPVAPGKFRYARRTAAALAYVAMGSLEKVILLPFADRLGQEVRVGRSRANLPQVLDCLTRMEAAGTTDLALCAEQFARRRTAPATVLLISDLLDCDEQFPRALARLRTGGHDVTILHVFAPQDARPELAGPISLRGAESDEQMNVQAGDELLENYRAAWDRFRVAREADCTAQEVVYVAAPTDAPFEHLILNTLRAAGVLSA